MPRQVLRDSQLDFSGGLNLTADIMNLGPKDVRRADECRLNTFGALHKRGGTRRTSAAIVDSYIQSGYGWFDGTSTRQIVIANGRLYDGGTVQPAAMTWTAKGAASDFAFSPVRPSIVGFRDGSAEVVYVADGGLLNKYDGTTVTTNIASTPSVSVLAVFNLRLFGLSGTNQTLYWSGLSNGDTLGNGASGGGSAIIRTFGQQNITALLPLGASLMIFHTAGVSRFTGWGQDDISIDSGTRGVSSDVGTVAPHSPVAVENVGYFASDRGIYQITEEGVTPIGVKIESVIQQMDKSQLKNIFSAHNKAYQEVLFFIPGFGIYAYNYRRQCWTGPWAQNIFTISPTPTCMWFSLSDGGSPFNPEILRVLVGHDDGHVRHLDYPGAIIDDTHTDDTGGLPLTMYVQTRRFFFGNLVTEKSLRFAYVHTARPVVGTGGQLQWDTQVGSTFTNIPTAAGAETGFLPARVQISGRGSYVDFTVFDGSSGAFAVKGVEADAFNMGARY